MGACFLNKKISFFFFLMSLLPRNCFFFALALSKIILHVKQKNKIKTLLVISCMGNIALRITHVVHCCCD